MSPEVASGLMEHIKSSSSSSSTSSSSHQPVLISRDISTYVDCILNNRQNGTPPDGVSIRPYQRFYPLELHLKVATYWFCLQDLEAMYRMFNYRDLSCEKSINTVACRNIYATAADLEPLEDALKQSDNAIEDILTLSCRISAPLTACEEDQFVRCSEDYHVFRNYEMAVFGTDCLQENKLYSSYTHMQQCISDATPTRPGLTQVWMLPPLLLAIAVVVSL